jgi:hypothetical protein
LSYKLVLGVPELLRPLCWRLFLDYLPKEREDWSQTLKQRRQEYVQLVDNLIATHVNDESAEDTLNDHVIQKL